MLREEGGEEEGGGLQGDKCGGGGGGEGLHVSRTRKEVNGEAGDPPDLQRRCGVESPCAALQ